MAALPHMNKLAETVGAVRRQYPMLVLQSCVLNLLVLVTSIYMLQVYDRVLSSGSLDTLLWLTLIALFAVAIYGLLELSRRMTLNRAAGWLEGELNAPMLRQTMQMRLEGENGRAGTLDVADMRRFYGSPAALAFLDAPWSVVFLLFIWLLHPGLGAIATLGALVLLSLTFVNDALTRHRQTSLAQRGKVESDAASRYVDAGDTISPLGMAGAIFDGWRERQAELLAEQRILSDRTTTILAISRSIRLGLQIAVLGAGAYLVLGGAITAGAMIAASIVMGRALAPIEGVTGAWRAFVAAKAARANLDALFARVTRSEQTRVKLPRPDGRLGFEDVFLVPAGSGEPILSGVNLTIEPGENCTVLGPSGSGKSTLCRLAVGAWKPTRGHVRLDGADVFERDPDDLGPHIGYLPQEVELFPGTIAQNIARFGEVDSNAVIAAAQLAGVHELILAQPQGYETRVELHGHNISLGQRQRLALARAFYGGPSLVVLDEPNSNMDADGERALTAALQTLKRMGTTVIVVTHRIAALNCADKVLALHDGAVANFGPRSEVVRPVNRPVGTGTSAGADQKPDPRKIADGQLQLRAAE